MTALPVTDRGRLTREGWALRVQYIDAIKGNYHDADEAWALRDYDTARMNRARLRDFKARCRLFGFAP